MSNISRLFLKDRFIKDYIETIEGSKFDPKDYTNPKEGIIKEERNYLSDSGRYFDFSKAVGRYGLTISQGLEIIYHAVYESENNINYWFYIKNHE